MLAERAHKKNIDLACAVAPDVPTHLRGDPVRLRQVLTNLVSNAVKFTEKGEVAVEVRLLRETAASVVVRIDVRDTGIGIPKERHAAIFESFTQADGSTTRRHGGTGLGLTICRQLVHLMGGRIGLESESGKGSTFWIELALPKAEVDTRRSAGAERLQGLYVLVVDDNETNRVILHRTLGAWGCRTVEAASGAEGDAARGASLGRIYSDLGFDEVGQLEASRSLAIDPTSASAHRFLSDLYVGQPRLEVARASQLLVSQLLSPPTSDPVQPSAPFIGLDVIPATGPLRPSFNEYSPLFEQDRLRFSSEGAIGNNDTHTTENIVSGLYGRTSLSAGQYYYHTNGFRENNGVRHEIYSLFGETQLTPELSVQAEYRYRQSNQGDLFQQFDPAGFSPNLDRDIDQHIGRFGARYSPSPGSTFLASAFVGEREEKVSELVFLDPALPPTDADLARRSRGWSAETQYIHERTSWNGVFGLGTYPVENRAKDLIDYPAAINVLLPDEQTNKLEDVDQYSAYGYLTLTPDPRLQATVGASLDTVDNDTTSETRLDPKLGVRYQLLPQLALRAAYFRTLKRELLFQQTIQPTQVAGFNQLYDDFTGTRADVWALGADADLPFGMKAGIEGGWRMLDIPSALPTGTVTQQADEWRASAYLFQTLGERWALGARAQYDRFRLDDDAITSNDPEKLDTWTFPLTARWFDPNGLFAEASATFLYQHISRGSEATLEEGSDGTWLLGGAFGWRLPERRGLVAIQVANLLDSKFKYEDDNFRTNEDVTSAFLPERTVLLRVNLNF